mgnify:CR=1 FL=1
MELGNLCFGHSRGEYLVQRTDEWGEPMFDLQDAIQPNCSPYGTDFENDVFAMATYFWGECACGYEDKEVSFCEDNPHQRSCWQFERQRIDNTYGCTARLSMDPNHSKYEKALVEALNKFNLPYQGNAIHCTCSHKDRWNEFCENNGHAETCGIVRPNFLYRPTGFELRWYKTAMRDSYMNREITVKEWQEMLEKCKESLSDDSAA